MSATTRGSRPLSRLRRSVQASGPVLEREDPRVITRRLAIDPEPRFFTADEFQTVRAIADRIVPQPATRPPIPVAALVDDKLHRGGGWLSAGGNAREGEAWRRGLRALDAEASVALRRAFSRPCGRTQDTLLARMENGELKAPAWGSMPPKDFFKQRMARDIVLAYYAHPTAWSEIGWGGPASPRGYVRMDFNERDPWEAAEARGDIDFCTPEEPPCSDDPSEDSARSRDGRAPDVFRPGGWVPMREYREKRCGRLRDRRHRRRRRHAGLQVGRIMVSRSWRFDAGPYFRPLEDFASDETEQTKLYWTDDRIVDGDNPLQMGSNNSGKAVGGSHRAFCHGLASLSPEWFKSRSVLGYGADWPLDWREMWDYYTEVEEALKIAGPINYPWGPHRPRYPYRAHELNAAARALAKGCEALGIKWTETPLATLSAPRGLAHPCVYRGFCVTGCSTNAKQSALVTWIPRAIAAGAEIRDLAMVGKIEVDRRRTGDRRALLSRGTLAFSARAQRRRRGLRDRDAAAAVEFGNRPVSRRPRQQFRPGREESDGAIQSGRLGRDGRGSSLVQRAAIAGDHRTLELRGQGQGLLRRL